LIKKTTQAQKVTYQVDHALLPPFFLATGAQEGKPLITLPDSVQRQSSEESKEKKKKKTAGAGVGVGVKWEMKNKDTPNTNDES